MLNPQQKRVVANTLSKGVVGVGTICSYLAYAYICFWGFDLFLHAGEKLKPGHVRFMAYNVLALSFTVFYFLPVRRGRFQPAKLVMKCVFNVLPMVYMLITLSQGGKLATAIAIQLAAWVTSLQVNAEISAYQPEHFTLTFLPPLVRTYRKNQLSMESLFIKLMGLEKDPSFLERQRLASGDGYLAVIIRLSERVNNTIRNPETIRHEFQTNPELIVAAEELLRRVQAQELREDEAAVPAGGARRQATRPTAPFPPAHAPPPGQRPAGDAASGNQPGEC